MRLFHRHRHRNVYGEKKISPWMILLICIAATLIVTVIIGNLLNGLLDEETYRRLTSGEDTTSAQAPNDPSPVRDVHAYAFSPGEDTDRLWEMPEISVTLNLPNGTLFYASAVTERLGYSSLHTFDLQTDMEELTAIASYISGIFYPSAFAEEDTGLRYAETAKESALLQEFVNTGGNEILLCGLPLENETVDTDAILSYIHTIRHAVGDDTAIGVAFPFSFVTRAGSWKVIGKLLGSCDFCALDLREADNTQEPTVLLQDCAYYLTQYDMRLLLCETQTDLLEAAWEQNDLQTATAEPSAPSTDNSTNSKNDENA